MSKYCFYQKLTIFGVLLLFGSLITKVDMDQLYGEPSSKESHFTETTFNCQISGTITDVSTEMPIQNAKISLLDPSNRDVLYTDIYTNTDGTYEATVEVDFTDVSQRIQNVPLTYWISEPHPNPVSPAESSGFTIQYTTPNNRHVTPVLKVFNILGREVDHRGPLANGVYLYRLNFNDGHFSDTKKMVLSSSGRLDISLRQVFRDPKHQIGKDDSQRRPGKVMSDSIEVLYVIEKDGYAYTEISKNLVGGVDNIHDYTLVSAYEEISSLIDESGGTIEHSGVFKVEFQEGAFTNPVSVSVSRTDLPGPLPSDITAASSAFSINTGGVKPENCAIVSFNVSSQSQNGDEGTPGIYRWDGEQWQYAGGNVDGDNVVAYMRNFSIFLTGFTTAQSKRIFRFANTGSNDAVVYVQMFQLFYPDRDLPITGDWGVPCFPPPFEPPVSGNLGRFPQGFYQFCAEWIDDVYGPRHRIVGGNPPNWTYVLSESSSLIVPPVVFIDTGIAGSLEGLCSGVIIQVVVQATGIVGIWSGTLPDPYGPINLQITEGYWTYFGAEGSESLPVVIIDIQEQYVILWDEEWPGYQKVEWTVVSDNQITLSFFNPKSTMEEAINETEPYFKDVLMTRSGG